MILSTPELEPIGFADFVARVKSDLDPESEESILALAPYLRALGRNRAFVADYLARTVAAHDFQRDNQYTSPMILLARGQHFLVRVAGWPPAGEVDKTPSGEQLHVYEDEHRAAHSHAFALLTVGYWGPGYETDVYECDPAAIRAGGERPGQCVELRSLGRYQLSEGTVMYYPAHRVAHVQHPPSAYSISLNLIVKSRFDEMQDQFFFDVPGKMLTRAIGSSNDTWRYLMQVAGAMPDLRFAPALESVAANHPARRVRAQAAETLARIHG
jgi:hypothetical protein